MLDLDYMLDSIQLHRVCLESVGIMYTASLKYTVKVIISEGKYYTVGSSVNILSQRCHLRNSRPDSSTSTIKHSHKSSK